MAYNGGRYVFGDGSLHYPITVADNGIRDNASGVSLIADFYGPRHEEIAGTLDDSQAGLLASFGAKHDERPAHLDVITDADHVRGMMYSGTASANMETVGIVSSAAKDLPVKANSSGGSRRATGTT